MTRPRAADDFAVIRARMEELRAASELRCRRNEMPARSARGLIIPRLAYWRTAVSGVSRLQFVENSSDRDLERELARQARRGGPRKPSQVPDSYYVHRLVK
jgi:hypothetical protein